MRGLLQIGRSLALRHLPRLGAAGGSRGVVSLPGFSGRSAGYGPGRSVARGLSARCLGTSLSWRYLTALVCRRMAVSVRGDTESLRPACRVQRRVPSRRLPKAPGAALSRTAWGRVQAPLVGVQPTPVPSAPSRGAGKAAASSRCALQPRRASVVTSAKRTVKRSERASDDAGTCNRQSADRVDTQRRKQVLGAAQVARWSGAKWCQCSTAGFSSGNLLRSGRSMLTGRGRVRGAAFRAGGTLYLRAL